jgi:hypothetical protein
MRPDSILGISALLAAGATLALDPERRVIRLTNDRPLGRSNPALLCFNEISRREGIVMNRGNVEAYLAFFLEVHLGRPGRFLPGRQEAEIAANLAQYSFLPKRLLEVLEKPKRPGSGYPLGNAGAQSHVEKPRIP